ncbi:hypothetical protein G647_07013 [Cladophialophora carrionii CBS 160.54]|uniref:Enoyl reductase (ER) domain-containing protein n=1 Tax=Cladophialophora carrionii CBS 160.54 TaxID=1279043 RepID=V9D1Z0_9EURO|nr:uncharacterized protein G647_07013 [Cladophialophora carrionii CBS 160.54]ETI20671.1 hypothetical protein G647_07013 [Cladophialophora carrionii CBS 160.54]
MRALHLPGVPSGQAPPFSFPDKPASPSDLQYTAAGYPGPDFPSSASEHMYLIRVLVTALTRGELTWHEILDPSRFQPHSGAIPGHDVVGLIDKVFPCSKLAAEPKFSCGDQIWALLDFGRDGAAAEYTLARETELSLVPQRADPHDISDEEWEERLATLPLSGLTGYQALFTQGGLPLPTTSTATPAKRVLVLGAAGSVGLPTLQLAKAANMTVIATASATSSAWLLASLLDPSTDTLLDYTSPGYTSVASSFHVLNLPPVDLVVDCIGGETLSSLLLTATPPLSSIVRPGGRVITLVAPLKVYGEVTSAQMTKNCASAGVDAGFFIVKPSGEELDTLGRWTREGKLAGYVHGEKAFPLAGGRLAMQITEARGRKGCGKVVVRVAGQ